METEVVEITAYENDNGKGILATVRYMNYELVHQGINVTVHLELDWDASLAEIERRAIEDANQQLKDLVAGF